MSEKNSFVPNGRGQNGYYKFEDPTQWSLGHVPTEAERAFIDSKQLMISSKDETVQALNLQSHLGVENSTLSVGHGNSTITGWLTVIQGELINHGAMTFDGLADFRDKTDIINGKDGTMTFHSELYIDSDYDPVIHNEGSLICETYSSIGQFQNNGVAQFADGSEITGSVTGTGTISGSLIFDGAVSAGQLVEMGHQDMTIQVEHQFHGTIEGFDTSNATININTAGHGVANLTYVENLQGTGGTLEIDRGAEHYGLNLLGNFQQAGFHVDLRGSHSGSGIELTYQTPAAVV